MSALPVPDPAAGPWPEVPPFRPPVPPYGPPAVPSTPPAPPVPVLPTWYESAPPAPTDPESRLLERRIVLVGGHLDAATAQRATASLLLLDGAAGPVDLHLSCPDGDLDAALALADAVDLLDAPVHAVVRGTLGGPAVAVLAAAAERTAHRHATVVLSLPRREGKGTADELAVSAAEHDRAVARLRDLVVRATGRDPADVEADLRAGRVLSAEEAQAYGLVTHLR